MRIDWLQGGVGGSASVKWPELFIRLTTKARLGYGLERKFVIEIHMVRLQFRWL